MMTRAWVALIALVGAAALAGPVPDHQKIVGCYWGAWSFYRLGDGTFDVDDIDPQLCTHGFYGFADLDEDNWVIKPVDPWYDQAANDPGCDEEHCKFDSYRRFVQLKSKNPKFVPMLSVGGWNAGSKKFSVMAKDPAKRASFIKSVIPFLKRYGFEGLDFDWEYPGSRDGADPEHDRDNFSILVEQLAKELKKSQMLFSAAVSPGKKTIDLAYDLPGIAKHFDFLNVMCYDYHGWWENHSFTGHNSPLYRREEETVSESHPGYAFNVYDTIMYFIAKGVPKNKLVMGMPAYGRGFQLKEAKDNGLYCPVTDGIPMGPYTLQDGIWGYQEIMQAFNNESLINLPHAVPKMWTVVEDDCYHAPYAYNGPYWIGYDTPKSISIKAKFINFLGIAGAMIWSLDTDDFKGQFHQTKFPLLMAIHETLADGSAYNPEDRKCQGTAPMCDLPLPTECSRHNDLIAFPGDCHKYLRCVETSPGKFITQEFDCQEYVFNPNVDACMHPQLPGTEALCPAE